MENSRIEIALISPYHSGSHQAWAEGYAASSQHAVRLFTLPGRFWKWRMHGSAITLAKMVVESNFTPDLFLVDDMLDVTAFLALLRHTPHAARPVALYMHENQLTYPLHSDPTKGAMRRQRGERDHHYVFVNYTSMLAADHIFFNSQYHLDSWFAALPNFLKHFPDYNEFESIDLIKHKSSVLPVGIAPPVPRPSLPNPHHAPLILWNQRWEYDKNPEGFFDALYALKEAKMPFQLAVCGENFSRQPTVFDEAREKLAAEIIHWGFAESERYRALLWSADIVLSTAWHEFFGISVVEAILHRTFPLLPNRLSYPELIPEQFHEQCLYDDAADLHGRLKDIVQNWETVQHVGKVLSAELSHYTWSQLASIYDQNLSNLLTTQR